MIDLVASAVYPDLERKAGGPDNWVEQVGGLPSYIERIAKHLHYEQGYSISRAIATAVNTVKRWAAGGVVAVGRPQRVSAKTQATAAKALAEWEAKKARARAIPGTPRGGGGRRDLAAAPGTVGEPGRVIDLALTKDGRKSYKRRGKWGHGFVPLDKEAKLAKAKGSPIAMKRINRLYATKQAEAKATPKPKAGNAPGQVTTGKTTVKGVKITRKGGGTERVKDIGQVRTEKAPETGRTQRTAAESKANERKVVRRSDKPWSEIPETQKTVRNGKKYTLTTFGGKTQLTEWFGPNYNQVETGDIGKRKLSSASNATLQQMTTAELRRLLRVKGQPKSVRTKIYAMINQKMKARKKA